MQSSLQCVTIDIIHAMVLLLIDLGEYIKIKEFYFNYVFPYYVKTAAAFNFHICRHDITDTFV